MQVQRNLNQQAGLGLRPVEPEFDVSRAYDLAEKYVSYEKWNDARWTLEEPVENFMQSVPDDSIRRNADFQWRSGMSPKIIRRAEPGACKWCRALAGTYDYAQVRETGSDVYRRHENCRCVVEYDPGDGKRQDVNSKKWIDPSLRSGIRRDKSLPTGMHGDNIGVQLRKKKPEQRLIENAILNGEKESIIKTIADNHSGLSGNTPSQWKELFEKAGFSTLPLNKGTFRGIQFDDGG